MFPTLIVYRGYQNQPHRVDLARCQMCHEREARFVDWSLEILKTRGSSYIRLYTQGIYMVYTWYIPCISKAYGVLIHMYGIYHVKHNGFALYFFI